MSFHHVDIVDSEVKKVILGCRSASSEEQQEIFVHVTKCDFCRHPARHPRRVSEHGDLAGLLLVRPDHHCQGALVTGWKYKQSLTVTSFYYLSVLLPKEYFLYLNETQMTLPVVGGGRRLLSMRSVLSLYTSWVE